MTDVFPLAMGMAPNLARTFYPMQLTTGFTWQLAGQNIASKYWATLQEARANFLALVSTRILLKLFQYLANNPTGDLAEHLFCKAFGWDQASNSVKGFDATGAGDIRYQIKSRRLHQANTSRQVSALRQLESGPFDILAGVLFAPDYTVQRAALIPISVVQAHAHYRSHTNAHIFHLRDALWDLADVEDATEALRAVVL